MMKLNKLLAISLLAGLGFSSLMAMSNDKKDSNCCPDSCCPDSCCNDCCWMFHVDWLYWRPLRCGTDYVFASDPVDGATSDLRKSSAHKWASGVRAGVFYINDEGTSLGARYLYYRKAPTSTTVDEDENLQGTRFHPANSALITNVGIAKGEFTVEYHNIDLEIVYRVCGCDDACVQASVIGGIHLFKVDQKIETKYQQDESATVYYYTKQTLDTTAGGLYMGAQLQTPRCCCLSLYGKALYKIARAGIDEKSVQTEVNVSSGATEEVYLNAKRDCDQLIPGWEVLAGLCVDFTDCVCYDFGFLVGYEMRNYCCMPDFLTFVDSAGRSNPTRNGSNIGFEGLVVRLRVSC